MWTTYKSGEWWVVECRYSDKSTSVTKVHVKSKYSALELIHYLNGGELGSTVFNKIYSEDSQYEEIQSKYISDYLNK